MADDAVPQPLPLFPLQTVLFPSAVLPLRIFELRYLDMIGRAHREGAPFGVVSLRQGGEVQRPGGSAAESPFADESLAEVGTLAQITHLLRPQPGLLVVRCVGTRRFRLGSHERRKGGLWVGEAELLRDDVDVAVPDDLAPVRETLRQLIRAIETEVTDPQAWPFTQPLRLDDCAWLANTWASLLPIPLPAKQSLLETESPLLRLELVADFLERPRSA
jgi:uncharacterized protein